MKQSDEQVTAMRVALRRLFDAMSAYFELHGAEHEVSDCPEDDTCECQVLGEVNAAFAAALPFVQDDKIDSGSKVKS